MSSVGEPVVTGGGVRVGDPAVTGARTLTGGPVEVATGGVGRSEFGALADRVTELTAEITGHLHWRRDYRHVQSAPAEVWQVRHDLGFSPSAFLAFDSEGRPVSHGGNITHPVPGEVMEVRFGTPCSGYGYAG